MADENALDDGSVPFELPATTNTLPIMGEESKEVVESLLQRLKCLLPVISTETLATLRESITSQSEGSVVLPGQLHWTVDELSLALLRVSIHWSWQGTTTATTATCLLNVLSKRAQLVHVAPEDANKPHAPSALFENIQISFEQTIRISNASLLLANNNNKSLLPTRLFCKADTITFLALEFATLTLSGTLLEPPHIPISRVEHAQLEVAQVTLTSASKPTSAHHIFLASFLSILYTILIPHASLLSTARLVLNTITSTTTNKHSAIPPSRMMAPFRSTPRTTMGDVFRHFYNTAQDSVDIMTKYPSLNTAVPNTKTVFPSDSNLADSSSHSNTNAKTNTNPSRWDKIRGSVSDSLAVTAGCVVAGASFVTPIGAVASVAALGVKDAAHAAAQKGQQVRGAVGYKFGDVTRGIVASVKEKKQHQQSNHSRAYSEFDELNLEESGNTDLNAAVSSRNNMQSSCEMNRPNLASSAEHSVDDSGTSNQPPQQRLSRYAGVLGSSVGAGVGLALAGPIGFVAGSLAGSQATQSALHKKKDTPPPPPCTTSRTISGSTGADNSSFMHPDDQDLVNQLEHHNNDDSSKPAFRLGDNLRGIAARGKQVTGRNDSSSYQFGDFSRGLFSGKKTGNASLMPPNNQEVVNQLEPGHSNDDSSKPGFRLGDNLRGITAWGKQSAPADNSSLMHSDDQEVVNDHSNDDSSKPAFRLGDNLRGITAWGKPSAPADNSSLMHSDDQEVVNQVKPDHSNDNSNKPAFRLGDNLRGIAAWGKQPAPADNSSLMHSDDQEVVNQVEPDHPNDDSSKPAFRLGDNLRGIAARGKEVTGRNESSSYQFGDFSRGLFSGKKT
jgi:hypothetical protein